MHHELWEGSPLPRFDRRSSGKGCGTRSAYARMLEALCRKRRILLYHWYSLDAQKIHTFSTIGTWEGECEVPLLLQRSFHIVSSELDVLMQHWPPTVRAD